MRELLENENCILEIKSVPIDKKVNVGEKTIHKKEIEKLTYFESFTDNNGIEVTRKIVLDKYFLSRLFEKQKQLQEITELKEVESNLPF